jgi:hypothetical protein
MHVLATILFLAIGGVRLPSSFNFLAVPPVAQPGAAWIYEGRYGAGIAPFIAGSNERVNVLPSNLSAYEDPIAIALFRGPFDFRSYPLRISLVDKLFTATQKLPRAIMYTAQDVRQYEPSKPAYDEMELRGPGAGAFTASGPFPANGPIIEQYQPAFRYAVDAMHYAALSSDQTDLSHYVVLFVDTPSVTWIEFGPAFAVNETPHFGCQTELGRDMVFAYRKAFANEPSTGPLLPCF